MNTDQHTLLLVDDKPANLEILFDYLENYNFDIRIATDGEMALRIVNHTIPDIILLDVMMPVMDGFETCKHLKSNDLTKDIPIIFITALSDIEWQVKGFELGGADYITKPIQVEVVLARIQTQLALRETQKKLEAKNAELEKSEAKFRSLIENSPDIITIINVKGRLLFINHTLPNHTLENIIGSSVYQYLPDSHHEIYRNTLTYVFQTGESREIEMPEVNGQMWNSRFVPIEYGNKIASVMVVATDITERKQIEKAIKKANEELEQSLEDMATLNYIVQTVSTLTDLKSVLEIVLKTIAQLFQAQGIVLGLFDDAQTAMTILSDYHLAEEDSNLPGLTIPMKRDPVIRKILKTGRAIVIPQAQTSPLTKNIHPILQNGNIHCLLITPLQVRGKIIGLLTITNNQINREFTDPEVELAETITSQVAGAIENARLFEEEHHQRQVAESLQEVALVLNNSLQQETVLVEIMKQLRRVIEYDSGGIFLQEENKLTLFGGVQVEPHLGYSLPLTGKDPAVSAFKRKEAIIIGDVRKEPHWQVWPGIMKIRSWMGIPLLHGQKAVGVLTIDNFEINVYRPEDAQIAQIFANQAAIAIQNAHLFNQVIQAQKETEVVNQALLEANERMQTELNLARTIQYGLIPTPSPNWNQLDVICYTTPASTIGGDFYTYHAFDAQRFALAVGDISGKGVSAALLMATSLSQFDAALAQNLSPTERLVYLDNAIKPYTQQHGQNCAMCYIEITLPFPNVHVSALENKVGTLHMVNAGCIPPYVKHLDGTVTWHKVGGFALGQGLGAEVGYDQVTTQLNKGDMIILTSDGVVEAQNEANKMFGFERLEQVIQNGPQSNAEMMLDHLKKAVFAFVKDAKPKDDLTIIVVQI